MCDLKTVTEELAQLERSVNNAKNEISKLNMELNTLHVELESKKLKHMQCLRSKMYYETILMNSAKTLNGLEGEKEKMEVYKKSFDYYKKNILEKINKMQDLKMDAQNIETIDTSSLEAQLEEAKMCYENNKDVYKKCLTEFEMVNLKQEQEYTLPKDILDDLLNLNIQDGH